MRVKMGKYSIEIVREVIVNGVSIISTRDQGQDNFYKVAMTRIGKIPNPYVNGTVMSLKTTVNEITWCAFDDGTKESVSGISEEVFIQRGQSCKNTMEAQDRHLAREVKLFKHLHGVDSKIQKYISNPCWRSVKGLFAISHDFDSLDDSVLHSFNLLTDNFISTDKLIKAIEEMSLNLMSQFRYSEFERLNSEETKSILLMLNKKLNPEKDC